MHAFILRRESCADNADGSEDWSLIIVERLQRPPRFGLMLAPMHTNSGMSQVEDLLSCRPESHHG